MTLSVNCRGRILDLSQPAVMGVINLTPDSFYLGSRYGEYDVLKIAEEMLTEGAKILDLGPMSSRPGAKEIGEQEEISRLEIALKNLRNSFPDCLISVDTYRSSVARFALDGGADIINDISGGRMDRKMIDVISEYQPGYILMHMKGEPQNMHLNPVYDDVVLDVMNYFAQKIKEFKDRGVYEIIIDPGFGFGKTIGHNFALLHDLSSFQIFGLPVLAGISRKSMIWKTLGISPEESLTGTASLHMMALQGGVHILRVHDVREAVQSIKLWRAFSGIGIK